MTLEYEYKPEDDNSINHWLLPCNENNYDIEKAYLKYHTIDFKQSNSQVAVNDIVYVYKSHTPKIVRFTCRVTAVNKESSNKKDRDCYINSQSYENKTCYMTLMFINRIEDAFPDLEGLKKNGVSIFRKISKLPEAALKYIKSMEAIDYSMKRFDGIIPSDITLEHWSMKGGDEEELKEKAEKEANGLSDTELFEKSKQQGSAKPKERASTISTYVRNTFVAEASKRRAKGVCQLCGNSTPFKDKNGNPYLESHHIIWLSEGGADTLDNTAALCPNCHKKMHVLNDQNDVKKLQEYNCISVGLE